MKQRLQSTTRVPVGVSTFQQTFTTLAFILFSFFILLASMSTRAPEKEKTAFGSLLGAFGLLPGSESRVRDDVGGIGNRKPLENGEVARLFEESKAQVADLITRNLATPESAAISADEVTGDIKVVLTDDVLFPSSKTVLTPRLFPLLDRIAGMAKIVDGTTRVTGHTDDQRADRIAGSNWQLSLERGAMVARHLEAAGQLPAGSVIASGAASFAPRVSNAAEQGRALNRRVEISITARKETRP